MELPGRPASKPSVSVPDPLPGFLGGRSLKLASVLELATAERWGHLAAAARYMLSLPEFAGAESA